MMFKNSENAMAIVSGAINAKKAIALESFSTMIKTRRGENAILTLESPDAFQEFSAKINDVFSTLQNMDVDEAEITAVLKDVSRSPRNHYEDSTIMFVNPDNVGRINASYIQDFAQDIASTAEKILNGEAYSVGSSNVSTPVVEGIKRQVVSGTYKGNTSKNCFGELPMGIPYSYDASFVNTVAIPFVKTFSAKRAEIAAEITSLDRAATSAFAIVSTISQSKEVLGADTESRQFLNAYLAAAGTALVDIISFASYLIIRKMDIMIANATALNAMCDTVRNSGLLQVRESVANSEPTTYYGIDNADILIGVVRGVFGKIKYTISNYYDETNHPINDQMILDMVGQYGEMTYPTEIFVTILSQKKDALQKLLEVIRTSDFPSPVQLATDLGLYKNMVAMYSDKINAISDISSYTRNSMGAVDKAFSALAELRALEGIIMKIKERGTEIAVVLHGLRDAVQNSNELQVTDSVRNETVDVINVISANIHEDLIPEIFCAIDKLCISLDSYIDSALSRTTPIVPDMSMIEHDVDFVESAMQSILYDEEVRANIAVNNAAKKFHAIKTRPISFIATEAEAPATNPSGATPGNPTTAGTSSGTNNDSNKSVEVKEDETKQTDADAAQNADAAVSTTKDPASFKETVKKMMEQAMKFFEDMISNFSNTIKSKKNIDASQYITENKDAILGRSFNGVTLKIPYFPELSTPDVLKEIGQVSAAVGALNAQSIKSSDEDKLAALLFPFVDFGGVTTTDDRIKKVKERYSGQENAEKEEFTGAKLRGKTQAMMSFCEEYYVDKKCNEVATALGTLKNTTKSMLNGLSSITDINAIPEDAKVSFVNRAVKMFSGAITTTYRNQANAYYSALKSLTPKKRAPKDTAQEQPVEPQTEQQPVDNTVPTV